MRLPVALTRSRRLVAWAATVTTLTAGAAAAQSPALPGPADPVSSQPGSGLPVDPTPPAVPAAGPGLPDTTVCAPPLAAPTGPRWQTPVPRPGYFVVPPTGPGYYSAFDELRGNYRDAPPKYPYPRVSPIIYSNADVNWSYLKNPDNTEHDLFDCLKNVPVCDGVQFTTGGEFRYQFRNDVNSNNRLTGVADAYNLFRTRVYGDLWVQDWLRFYGEYIDADYTSRSLPPLAIDANRGDFLNAFADLKVFQFGEDKNPVYVRLGRQELVYGSQRLISPLDWANTRRTFEGVKVFTRTKDYDLDVFGVRPVAVQANNLDPTDHNQFFSGAYFTYRTAPGQNLDLYYLNLENDNLRSAVGNGGVVGTYNVSTFGTRYVGQSGNWLWDAEGMVQTGHYANQSILANAVTASGGYQFKALPWNPQLWVGYDHASGDPDPQASGTRRTFNQLFPFGHYYFGFIDLVGRQNINDFTVQTSFFPRNWITCNAQFHVFRLDSDKDALYASNGSVVRQDKTGKAGDDVGNELDLTTNFHLTNHQDLLVGYSYLFAGSFIKNTSPVGATHDAMSANPSMFYLQYSYRW